MPLRIPMEVILWIAGISILLFAAYVVVFRVTHSRPLTYEQARQLARENAEAYRRRHLEFRSEVEDSINLPAAVANLREWIEVNEPLDVFPARVASLTRGIQSSCLVLAVERDGRIISMITEKSIGDADTHISLSAGEMIRQCKGRGGYSVLCLRCYAGLHLSVHRVPAEVVDEDTLERCADRVCDAGYHWIDILCADGDFAVHQRQYPETTAVEEGELTRIIGTSGICREMDYALQKEYTHSADRDRRLMLHLIVPVYGLLVGLAHYLVTH